MIAIAFILGGVFASFAALAGYFLLGFGVWTAVFCYLSTALALALLPLLRAVFADNRHGDSLAISS